MTEQELVNAIIQRHVRACRSMGIPTEDMERVAIEARELVRSGEFTESDLEPVRHNIAEATFQKFYQYESPRDISIH